MASTHGIVSDPWYVSTHGIHPHMGFTHGIVGGIRFRLHLHGNEGLKHILVSMFDNNFQQTP